VEEWLHDHPNVTHHVILDDDGDFKSEQPLVLTNWEIGVTKQNIEKAKEFLK
jgi:hypothetical protein